MNPSPGFLSATDLWAKVRKAFAPPPRLTVSEWADRERRLSPEAAAEPGPWRTERAEYLRGILDAIGDQRVTAVVVKTSSQVGKTEAILNAIGFHMHMDPSPMLVVQPTIEMGEALSKDRLATMIRDCPALTPLAGDPKAKSTGNTLLHKQFPGGHVTIAGANSPASLASRPVRVVFLDEVDRYPSSAGTEGDPVTLARARTKTFWNRKAVLTSTPTFKGSRIDQAYTESDQRRYFVPCAHCGEFQVLAWAAVKWDEGKPETARLYCVSCGTGWDEVDRLAAIRAGEWRGSAPFTGIAGFHLNELYSPWSSPAEVARQFVDARHSRNPERMRAWTNTCLGEAYEDEAETIPATAIAERAERWEGTPDGVLLRTVGIDVQADRVELEVVGWGADFESWSLEYRPITGDTTRPEVFADLDAALLELKPNAVCIDSGFNTDAVLRFCKDRFRRRIYAIKGIAGPGRPIWPKRGSRNNKLRVPHFMVGVDAAKFTIYGWLKLKTAGPGFCHFPDDRDGDYFDGLTAEEVRTRMSRGFPIREWHKRPGSRNEPLDCRVYAYAALLSLSPNWKRLTAARAAAIERRKAEEARQQESQQPGSAARTQTAPVFAPARTGFVNRWRY
jgi:phage terminase large subunit GpA-like protein